MCGSMDCRIIFSDIDGTLLNSNHQIDKGTRIKILELDSRGIPFILVSARMPSAVYLVQRQLGNHRSIVCYSGGLILDEQGNCMHSCQIKLELVAEIKELAKLKYPDVCCNMYGMNQWVVDDDSDPWVLEEERITEGKAVVGDIQGMFGQQGGIHKFLFMGVEEDIRGLEEELKRRYTNLTVLKSKDNYLEVMDQEVKKSVGVHVLCRHYGAVEEQAVAFGDGENDIDMLQAVKYGIAMGNALQTVKKQAYFVTSGNDEQGVLNVIHKL